jgi:ABC-type antimicrobial peptide transport system permease subunit
MNRIKEVGIYRAIGVSRRNLIFKFAVEACVLTTLTSVVGFLLAGLFIRACLGLSALSAQVFFFPAWMALLLLLFLYGSCLFFGTLPILLLLRRTPSEILSKYDI